MKKIYYDKNGTQKLHLLSNTTKTRVMFKTQS